MDKTDYQLSIRKRYNIRMDLKGVEYLHLSQGRNQWRSLVDTVMNLRVP